MLKPFVNAQYLDMEGILQSALQFEYEDPHNGDIWGTHVLYLLTTSKKALFVRKEMREPLMTPLMMQ
jgi:hypothetical protein